MMNGNCLRVWERLIRRSLENFCFRQKFRDDSFVFAETKKPVFSESFTTTLACLFRMTIAFFALFFSLILPTQSQASCIAESYSSHPDCYSNNDWNPGVPDNCGNGCRYDYDENNHKLTVTATKAGAKIPEGKFSSNYYEKGSFPSISSIEIDGEFSSIGRQAFLNNGATVSGKDGVLYTKNLGSNTFGNNNILTGTIIISDNQNKIDSRAPWYNATLNGTVILPPTIKTIEGMALYGLTLGANAKIYCGSENCEELFNEEACDKIDTKYQSTCRQNLNTLLSSEKLHSYPEGCTRMNASGCSKCKNENFKLNDGECDRLRYTPAEAAKVLHDDNTNSVTITFKK